MKRTAAAFLVSLAFAACLLAETGRLQGVVLNSKRAALSNARITMTSPTGDVVIEAMSGTGGEFSFDAPLGEYVLGVDAGGFGTLKRLIRVSPGVVYLELVAAPVASTDTPRQSSLQSNANLHAIVLDEKSLDAFPDEDSAFASTLTGSDTITIPGQPAASGPVAVGAIGSGGLAAGAVPAQGQFLSPGTPGTPFLTVRRAELIVNGEPAGLPPKDHIREVWVDADPFTVEYSRPGFARVHVSTVEPVNTHGSVAFNFRDESMDSSLPGFGGPVRTPYQGRYLRAEVAGPLFSEKLLTSFSFQRLGQDNGEGIIRAITPAGPVAQSVPTGFPIQTYTGRSAYRISSRHRLHVNGRYRSQAIPYRGGGTILEEQGRTTANRDWEAQVRHSFLVSSDLVHELRVQTARSTSDAVPYKEGVTVSVFRAFQGGGTSARNEAETTDYHAENALIWSGPGVTLRTGLQVRHIEHRSRSNSNVLGSFSFFSLDDFLAGRPIAFSQTSGETAFADRQSEFASFIQADWQASYRFSVSGGLRYEAQTNLRDYNNIDPRIAVAYQAFPSTVFRAGVGVFHERFAFEDFSDLSRRDGAITGSSVTIFNPSYPDPFLAASTPIVTPIRTSLAIRSDDLQAPYSVFGSFAIEQWFDSGLVLSASVDLMEGMRQLRIRNINAPFLEDVDPSLLSQEEVDRRRPYYPALYAVQQYESVGNLTSRNLTLRVRTPDIPVGGFAFRAIGGYTLGWTDDDAGIPADHYNRRAEWGRSTLYPRHRAWSSADVRAPWNVSLTALVQAHSGFPYTTFASADTNRDGSFNDRPPGVPRNANDGPNYWNLDARLSKALPFQRLTATLFVYGQNLLNSRNYAAFNASTSFGGFILTMPSTRKMELGARLRF